MMVADSLIALVTLGLALLFAAGLAQVWHIYLIMLIRSAGARSTGLPCRLRPR